MGDAWERDTGFAARTLRSSRVRNFALAVGLSAPAPLCKPRFATLALPKQLPNQTGWLEPAEAVAMTKSDFEKLATEEKQHFYQCQQCEEMVDKPQLDDVIPRRSQATPRYSIRGVEAPRLKTKRLDEVSNSG